MHSEKSKKQVIGLKHDESNKSEWVCRKRDFSSGSDPSFSYVDSKKKIAKVLINLTKDKKL